LSFTSNLNFRVIFKHIYHFDFSFGKNGLLSIVHHEKCPLKKVMFQITYSFSYDTEIMKCEHV